MAQTVVFMILATLTLHGHMTVERQDMVSGQREVVG